MISSDAADTWLFTTLSATAGVTGVVGSRIYRELAPLDVASPFLVFRRVDQLDVGPIGAAITAANLTYEVELVTDGESTDPIRTAALAADVALDRGAGIVAGGYQVSCLAQRELRQPALVFNGVTYQRLGKEYALFVGAP